MFVCLLCGCSFSHWNLLAVCVNRDDRELSIFWLFSIDGVYFLDDFRDDRKLSIFGCSGRNCLVDLVLMVSIGRRENHQNRATGSTDAIETKQ